MRLSVQIMSTDRNSQSSSSAAPAVANTVNTSHAQGISSSHVQQEQQSSPVTGVGVANMNSTAAAVGQKYVCCGQCHQWLQVR